MFYVHIYDKINLNYKKGMIGMKKILKITVVILLVITIGTGSFLVYKKKKDKSLKRFVLFSWDFLLPVWRGIFVTFLEKGDTKNFYIVNIKM